VSGGLPTLLALVAFLAFLAAFLRGCANLERIRNLADQAESRRRAEEAQARDRKAAENAKALLESRFARSRP